jgi:hypothetical protein
MSQLLWIDLFFCIGGIVELSTILSFFASISGLAASIFFVRGALSLSANSMCELGRSYYGLNEEVINSLSTQKADFVVGALVLLASFLLQVLAICPLIQNLVVAVSREFILFMAVATVSVLALLLIAARILRRRFMSKAKYEFDSRMLRG